MISNHLHRLKKYGMSDRDKMMETFYQKTKPFAKECQDSGVIIICKADKGNVTVVMEKDEYERKMLALVSDSDTYAETQIDPFKLADKLHQKQASY